MFLFLLVVILLLCVYIYLEMCTGLFTSPHILGVFWLRIVNRKKERFFGPFVLLPGRVFKSYGNMVMMKWDSAYLFCIGRNRDFLNTLCFDVYSSSQV